MTERKYKFCMMTTFYPPWNFGGDGILVHRLSNELAERGHEVDVIHCVDSYRLLAKGVEPGPCRNHPRVTIHSLRSPMGFLSPLLTQQTGFPVFKARQIKQVLAKGHDVIHYHNISLVGGPAVLRYGAGVKLMTLHDYWVVCPMHILFKFNRWPCVRRNCVSCALACRRPPQLWRYTGLVDRCVRHLDRIIAPSQFCLNKVRELGLNSPCTRLPSFAPSLSEAGIPKYMPDTEAPFFLFVGRLERAKALDTVIRAFRNYARARLVIVGTGTREKQLRALAQGIPNIEFRGFLSLEDILRLCGRSTALIMPSLCYESAPLTVYEAFSAGTPVIGRNTGAIAEIVRETGAGILYESEDGLLSAMDQLLDQPSLRHELGERAHEASRTTSSIDAHLQGYFALIEEVLHGRPNGRGVA